MKKAQKSQIPIPEDWEEELLEIAFALAGIRPTKSKSFKGSFARTVVNVYGEAVWRNDNYEVTLRVGRGLRAREFKVEVPMARNFSSEEAAKAASVEPLGKGYAFICMIAHLKTEMQKLLTGG